MKLCRLNFSQSLASVKGSGLFTCLLLFGVAIADVFICSNGGGNMGNNVGGGKGVHEEDNTSWGSNSDDAVK